MNVRSGSAERAAFKLPHPLLLLTVLLVGMIALPGCGGCWGKLTAAKTKKTQKEIDLEKELEKKKKKLAKPKDDFEPLLVRMLPSNDPTASLKGLPQMSVKPGHWFAVNETVKANNFDFPGELATFVEQTATNQPLEVEQTTSRLWSWCPSVLAKGRTKQIESMFYVPRRPAGLGKVYSLRSELHGVRGGRVEATAPNTICTSLKDYEHLIVVLAGSTDSAVTPSSYSSFDRLLSVKMPQVEAPDGTDSSYLQHYRVIRPSVNRGVPLPSHPLSWTTIAYMFWDDFDPTVLTNFQQQALLDWLHWGGQLVISGPYSLDKLKGSFLAPYLPAEAVQTENLEQAAFNELNANFSLERNAIRVAAMGTPRKGEGLRRITVLPNLPVLGVELRKHAEGREVPGTGGLVVERRVGGGRIAVTRFSLTDVRVRHWRNFDNFFNAVLLRRPPREFSSNRDRVDVKWADTLLSDMMYEPRISSTLRYFTRDVAPLTGGLWSDEAPVSTTPPPSNPYPVPGRRGMPFYEEPKEYRAETFARQPDLDDWRLAGYQSQQPSGVAAWNDEGAASVAARQALTEAAGIQIPRADFVMKVLAVYLLVLVPVNWLVFWTLGRVEWAWAAAPVIALVGAGAVIRLAQLDIGFARSRTEIAVMEIQGGYERAHLTRYTALYSSLSSSYTLAFDDPSALALPFASGPRNEGLLSITNYNDVSFRRDKDTSLAGVQVSSNSTGMVHSEQMFSLGNSPKTTETVVLVGDEAKGFSVRNTADLVLRDVGVFRRVDRPGKDGRSTAAQIETAYVAKLEPARSEPLKFKPLILADKKPDDETNSAAVRGRQKRSAESAAALYPTVWLPDWNNIPVFASAAARASDDYDTERGRVRLTQLARLASDRLRLMPGDVRLVAWTNQRLPGMRIRPEAPQNATFTLVLAHLVRGPLPSPKSDTNVAEDYFDPAVFEEADPNAPGETTEAPITAGSK